MADFNLPPSPKLSPLAQTLRFMKDPFALIEECRRELSPMFTLHLLGLGRRVFICEPELMKEAFKAPPDQLISGEVNAKMLGALLGRDATFSLDGEIHAARRKRMLPFFNGAAILDQTEAIARMAAVEVDAWPEHGVVKFLPWAQKVSLKVVVDICFGQGDEQERREIVEVYHHFVSHGLSSILLMIPPLQWDLGRFSPWGRILRMRDEVFAAVDRALDRRYAEPERFGELEMAANLCLTPDEGGKLLSRRSVRDEIMNDIFAGHETTGTTLAWCLERALAHPVILARVRDEIDQVTGGQLVQAQHFKQLPYLRAFLEECIRVKPISPVAGIRVVKHPYTIGGYHLEPGTVVAHSNAVFGMRPEVFENPERFDPERFLGKGQPAYSWNPFGGGRRMCLGKGLAEVELAVLMATVLGRREVVLAQKKVESRRAGIFFIPSEGLQVETWRR